MLIWLLVILDMEKLTIMEVFFLYSSFFVSLSFLSILNSMFQHFLLLSVLYRFLL